MSQSEVSLHSNPLIRLEEAFKSADQDNDDLLNKKEFTKFVEINYRKQCPPGMYESVCQRFKSDPAIGVNWNTAKTIYIQANQKLKSKSKSNLLHHPGAETSHSSSDSHSMTIRQNSVSISSDNGINPISDKLLQYKLHRRTSTLSSTDLHQSDTSSMIVDILDNKNKSLQNKLLKERNKRKKTEEIAQSLLNQNDEYKLQINSLTNENIQLKKQYTLVNQEVIKLRLIINESKNNIKHLTNQKTEIKKELNEAYLIYSKIEKDHNITIKKLKLKHKTEMEKLCNEKQAEKQKDINTIIKNLKINNNELQQTVDTLAESLVRKQQSLIEALQAVDNITKVSKLQEDVTDNNNNNNGNNNSNNGRGNKIKNKLKEWNQRRKSYALQRKYSNSVSGFHKTNSHSIADSDFICVSEVIKENDMPFQNIDENVELLSSIDTVENVNEMQFLSLQLTDDVVNNRPSIHNLGMADTVLFEQMKKMKQQMNDMKVEKHKYDSQHNGNKMDENDNE